MYKPNKQARKSVETSEVKRTESVGLISQQAAKGLLTAGSQPTDEKTTLSKKARHPKGHKVRDLGEVWDQMSMKKGDVVPIDPQYLRVTDTLDLGDVWIAITDAKKETDYLLTIDAIQMVTGHHVYQRNMKMKMSNDDFLGFCYLKRRFADVLAGEDPMDYEEWKQKMGEEYQKESGDESLKSGDVCEFLMKKYPFIVDNIGFLCRKICCHSYSNSGVESKDKVHNPTLLKLNVGTRGKFEFELEVRVFPLV